MTTAKTFGNVLSRIRREQGYSTAHQFFKSVGGSKSIGLAFMSYWDMERGKKLPKSWRLKSIMSALGIDPHSPKAVELVRAYFMELSGSDELLQIVSSAASAGPQLSGRDLTEAAIGQALASKSVNQTIEQWKMSARDIVTHICDYFLVATAGWVTFRELSEVTQFKPAAIKKALKALASVRLIEISGDKARSLFADKVVQPLPATPAAAAIKAAKNDLWNQWLADSKLVDAKKLTVRMTKSNMDMYRQHLVKALSLACVYANTEENRQDSAVYVIDARIFQILPRE